MISCPSGCGSAGSADKTAGELKFPWNLGKQKQISTAINTVFSEITRLPEISGPPKQAAPPPLNLIFQGGGEYMKIGVARSKQPPN